MTVRPPLARCRLVEFQCAAAARLRDEPLVATASQVSAWLLIEVVGPWGHDAIGHSELGPFAPNVWREALRRRGIRLVAIRRDLSTRHQHGEIRLVHVEAPRPGRRSATAHRCIIGNLRDVVPATESLVNDATVGAGWDPEPDRYVLVCTNGRHDACCATFGRPLVRALRESPWASEVWECSHIGGDRFAANIVLLPESLYFGNVDPTSGERLLRAHDDGRLEVGRFRGRSTLRLPEQAAEHAVRSRLGVDRIDAVIDITSLRPGHVEVALDDGRKVAVEIERVERPAPTALTCKGRPGLAYPEFRIVTIEVVQAKPATGWGV
ncbi:MAG: sucrase ferredoxin [Ilumatobacteraceae bacterium]